MGGVCSSQSIPFKLNEMDGQDLIALDAFNKMKLEQSDLDKLYNAFRGIDCCHSGHISTKELKTFFRAEDNRYNKKLLIDCEGTGKINFFEFVVILWKTLALDPKSTGAFAFHLCNRTGYLQPAGVRDFLETLHGKHFEEIPALKKTLYDLTNKAGGLPRIAAITCSEFGKLCFDHPVLVAPMVRMNLAVRKDFLGERFWRRLGRRVNADKITAELDFPYALSAMVVDLYAKKNLQLQFEERMRKNDLLGSARAGMKVIYSDHEAAEKAHKAREIRTDTDSGGTVFSELRFENTKPTTGQPTMSESIDQKWKKKQDFALLLQDDAAQNIVDGHNCPEKLYILQTHEFHYNSQGTEPAMPGNWNAPIRSKPSSPRSSPRVTIQGSSSPKSSPRGIPGDKIHIDGDRPKSRGSITKNSPRVVPGDILNIDGDRLRSRGNSPKSSPRGTPRDQIYADGDRPRSRGSDASSNRPKSVSGDRPRRSRGASLDVNPSDGRRGSGSRPQSSGSRSRSPSDGKAAGRGDVSPVGEVSLAPTNRHSLLSPLTTDKLPSRPGSSTGSPRTRQHRH